MEALSAEVGEDGLTVQAGQLVGVHLHQILVTFEAQDRGRAVGRRGPGRGSPKARERQGHDRELKPRFFLGGLVASSRHGPTTPTDQPTDSNSRIGQAKPSQSRMNAGE